ncbi:hypothetical protein BN2497_10625 [Janthinobacterium sp. CG23_2]|nr:hypothetical protein BN2497_10625 [Janthinobacterium sp. CG23_2]CUU31710.1 hypothetical protein BN3177_10625 [Janthinobacterium sp. CG23_2]
MIVIALVVGGMERPCCLACRVTQPCAAPAADAVASPR